LNFTRQKESEKDTEEFLFKEMRRIGGESSKWVCPNYSGKPDRICEFPSGLVVFVELKSEGKSPEPHQLREHKRMRKRCQFVEVLDTKQKVREFIEHYSKISLTLRVQP